MGSKWELYIPQNLGYGARQAGKIKPYSTLIFTVELVEIDKPEPVQESLKNTGDNSKKDARTVRKTRAERRKAAAGKK